MASSAVTDVEWTEYKEKFSKKYEDVAEDQRRRTLYAESKVKVEEHNRKFEAGEVTFKMSLNHFADQTSEERGRSCGRK